MCTEVQFEATHWPHVSLLTCQLLSTYLTFIFQLVFPLNLQTQLGISWALTKSYLEVLTV